MCKRIKYDEFNKVDGVFYRRYRVRFVGFMVCDERVKLFYLIILEWD